MPTGNIAAAAAAAASSIAPLAPLSPEPGDEQSSMPTRALWIGSIPAPTSSATLLQIFSPFGPVESARVLMHKVSHLCRIRELGNELTSSAAGSSTLSDSILPFPPGTR